MSNAAEFETEPVSADKLQSGKTFAASYAGEHVAGTEFVIGALFVAWGVGTMDILLGLLLGNLMAVLTWALVTAPIATDTRLTLYAYLDKIAGPGTIKLYSVINGILFCILAGAMITVSASAVRVFFDIPAQVNWYPTDFRFVLVALGVGAVVVLMAMKGFKKLAAFAEICAPWMVLMFVVGALALMPTLVAMSDVESISSFSDFLIVADQYVWVDNGGEMTLWHVAAFAWICNLAMHGGMGDMTLFRFAKSSKYGYYSALGMFIGHYVAWICAGIMGAAAALILKASITELDAGAVAFQALGMAGILAVIIAGWTTSNPTIYRAGLAFQSLNYKWDRTKVTLVVGIITSIIACFPFVFGQLMGFLLIMGLMMAPVGAIIVAEHWIFPKIGFARYWSKYKGNNTNYAAMITWLLSLALSYYLVVAGILDQYFILVPIWVFATVAYCGLASLMGAKDTYPEAAEEQNKELARKETEKLYLKNTADTASGQPKVNLPLLANIAQSVSWLSLVVCLAMGILSYVNNDLETLKTWLLLPTLIYFVTATYAYIVKQEYAESDVVDDDTSLTTGESITK